MAALPELSVLTTTTKKHEWLPWLLMWKKEWMNELYFLNLSSERYFYYFSNSSHHIWSVLKLYFNTFFITLKVFFENGYKCLVSLAAEVWQCIWVTPRRSYLSTICASHPQTKDTRKIFFAPLKCYLYVVKKVFVGHF